MMVMVWCDGVMVWCDGGEDGHVPECFSSHHGTQCSYHFCPSSIQKSPSNTDQGSHLTGKGGHSPVPRPNLPISHITSLQTHLTDHLTSPQTNHKIHPTSPQTHIQQQYWLTFLWCFHSVDDGAHSLGGPVNLPI